MWKSGMCGVTFNPNVNVSLWRVERERQTHTKRRRREMESGCVRKSQRNRCLSVSGRKGEAVRREMTEKGDGETGGVCVHALSWLRAGCYSSWRASPSSPRTSGVRSVCVCVCGGGDGGEGRRWQRWGGGCNGVKTFLPHITALRFLTRRAPSLRTLARLSHPLTLFPSVGSRAAYLRCIYMYKTGFAQTVMRYYLHALHIWKVSLAWSCQPGRWGMS